MTLGRVISAGNLVARIVFRDDTSGIARSNRRLANLRYNLERAAHASRNLGIAITGVSVLGVREWAKVETAQSKLIGQVGLLREEVEGPIADSIRNLGTLYGQTEAEGTEAFFKVASAQFGVVKSQEILEVSSRAAAAEFGSLNDITSLLISGLNSFPDTNAVIYMDQLSESVRLGNLNAGELTRTLPVNTEPDSVSGHIHVYAFRPLLRVVAGAAQPQAQHNRVAGDIPRVHQYHRTHALHLGWAWN